MNTLIKTFSIEDNEQVLIQQEILDLNNQLIQSSDFRFSPIVVNNYFYNSKNQLIKQVESENELELSAHYFVYDEVGDVIQEELHINGFLFEKTILEKTATGYIKTMSQDNLEIEKLVRVNDGLNWKNEFYVEGKLVEIQSYIFDSKLNDGKILINNFETKEEITVLEKYDSIGAIILSEEYNAKQKLLISTQSQYENEKIVLQTVKDFSAGENYYQNFYEYDSKSNEIKFESKNLSGKLISFHHRVYNEANQLVEEIGANKKTKGSLKVEYDKLDRFHYVYEYSLIK